MRDPKHPRQFTGESRRRIVEPRLARPASAASALPLRDAGGFPCRWGRRVRPRDPSSLRVRNNDTGQRTNNVQERTNREIKRRSRVVQVFPSTGSLVRLAGAVMCEQDEIWQESRYFSEARMNELYDDGRTRGIDGPVDWARLEAEARKMLESGLELADRVEAA